MTDHDRSSDAEQSDSGQANVGQADGDVAADGTGVETGGHHAPVATDVRTNERLAKAVGTYLVLGLGFVFTFFLAGQFATSGGGFGGGPFGGSGASGGYLAAILLSPLIAVFVGGEIGSEGGEDAVLDAGIASAVGFVVMFFVTLVLAASLGGGGSAQVGLLVGLAIGVGITGAATAAVARWERGFLDGMSNPPLAKSIVFGSLAYLVFTVGFVVALVLAGALSSGGGSGFGGIGIGLGPGIVGLGAIFGPILAVLVGLFAGRDGLETPGQAAVSGAVGATIGSLLMVIGLLVAAAIAQPGGASIQIPVGPIVGLIVGAGLTGAGAGYVGGR